MHEQGGAKMDQVLIGDRLATMDIGRKLGDVSPFGGAGGLGPHNVALGEAYLRTMWILIHPAVLPQQTWAEASSVSVNEPPLLTLHYITLHYITLQAI